MSPESGPFSVSLTAHAFLPFFTCRLFNRGRLRDDVRGARQRRQSGAIYRVFTDGGAEERQETQGELSPLFCPLANFFPRSLSWSFV